MGSQFVRVGAMAAVGRFQAADAMVYVRGTRVVVRTPRGLEVGEVLSQPLDEQAPPDGPIVRRMSVEDELLVARLEREKLRALAACETRLKSAGLPVVLIDAETTFDGSALYFYFLGERSPALDGLTEELAAEYGGQVRFEAFAELLEQGCGPGCGTDAATGAGCGSCGTGCAVSAVCGARLPA